MANHSHVTRLFLCVSFTCKFWGLLFRAANCKYCINYLGRLKANQLSCLFHVHSQSHRSFYNPSQLLALINTSSVQCACQSFGVGSQNWVYSTHNFQFLCFEGFEFPQNLKISPAINSLWSCFYGCEQVVTQADEFALVSLRENHL